MRITVSVSILVVLGMITFSSYGQPSDCDNLKFDIEIFQLDSKSPKELVDVNINVRGGTGPYVYHLVSKKRKNNRLDLNSGEIKKLVPGEYIVIIQDSNGCRIQEKKNLQ